MDLYTIPRAVFTRYLGAVKWPLDTGLKVAGRGEGPAAIALDRVDGTVRTLVGGLVGDGKLAEDGRQRLTAADERTRALRLRSEAELRRQRADQEAAEAEEQADRQRRAAAERAEQTRDRAEQQKTARRRQAADAERKRKEASDRAERKVQESIEERAKRERLETLEQRAEALDKQDDALTARDEAQRLASAAGAAKAARKED
jgi:flagellar biosynthesis GTPase FlhF